MRLLAKSSLQVTATAKNADYFAELCKMVLFNRIASAIRSGIHNPQEKISEKLDNRKGVPI
jgi:hypothetical protein